MQSTGEGVGKGYRTGCTALGRGVWGPVWELEPFYLSRYWHLVWTTDDFMALSEWVLMSRRVHLTLVCCIPRRPEVLSDEDLRSMVRNWHPDAERTPKGFYKNLSVIARVDPFTGEAVGSACLEPSRPQPAAEVQQDTRLTDTD